MLTKVLALTIVVLAVARLFLRRDSEVAKRFRIFVDVCLVLMAVVYGGKLLSMWLA